MTGFLPINKLSGPTSHDIVDRLRRLAGERTVGHAGTLDPFASGLLIVGIGRAATREFPKLVGLDKRYLAVLRLGATSDTDDRTGKIQSSPSPLFFKERDGNLGPLLEQKRVRRVLQEFTGKIEQVPPMYSAKKIKGKKLYELARAGQTIERRPVPIEIYGLRATSCLPPLLKLEIHCSSGTYIRALARDIGAALGCGAYLEELERTAVGPFTLNEAAKLEELTKENIQAQLLDIDAVLTRCAKANKS